MTHILSLQTILICIEVELLGGGSAINGAPDYIFLKCFFLLSFFTLSSKLDMQLKYYNCFLLIKIALTAMLLGQMKIQRT